MPHRLACVAILLFWAVAAGSLITRDILPDLLIGTPPDLRSLTPAGGEPPGPTRWAILVADDGPQANLRSVGQATTQTILERDGWVRWSSEAWIDSGDLLRGTPFQAVRGGRVDVSSTYEIDPSGNLFAFRARVRSGEEGELLTLDGHLKENTLVVHAVGPHPILQWERKFPYQAHGMVQNTLGPMDRMPGLQVGQRWESKVVSPLTGRVERVKVVVARSMVITWGNDQVRTLEVVSRLPPPAPMSVRTWVRPDGLVLRSEVPFPFVKVLLERQPDGEPTEGSRP